MLLFFQIYWTFFKIGLLGFGGGYAMLSLIHNDIVIEHQWLSGSEFTDIVAVSQMTPGPIGINAATYVGYQSVVQAGFSPVVGVLGSIIATLAVMSPSFILMILLLKWLKKNWQNPTLQIIFKSLRPTMIGLIASAALLLMNAENFGSPFEDSWQFCVSCFLFVAAFIGSLYCKITPIQLICLSGLAGYILYHP